MEFFGIFRKIFEIDPVVAVCLLVLAGIGIAGLQLYRKHNNPDRAPDALDFEGYYKISVTPMGFRINDSSSLFSSLNSFCYLKKDPFNIEVSIDEAVAGDGKKYRALAVVTVQLSEDRTDYVCRRYFGGETQNAEIIAGILNGNPAKTSFSDIQSGSRRTNPETLFMQSRSSNSRRRGKSYRPAKTNCDAEIQTELIIAFSSALRKLIEETQGGIIKEELRKAFLAKAMLSAMEAGHIVINISTFNIMSISE